MSISIIYNGEVIDEESLQRVNPDDIYRAVSSEIVMRQNQNYADQEANRLQAWLGDFVVRFWGRGQS